MYVFITGATGWVGSAVVRDLLNAGHRVAGLVRSDDKATELTALGAQAVRGTVDDHDVLRKAASAADAVIHTAFNHDFSKFAENVPDPALLRKSEAAARAVAERGVRVASIRLAPSVHGLGDHGFIPMLIGIARAKGVSGYIDEGTNRWAGVYRLDAARVYRLALEQGVTEPAYHAVADEGVPFKQIAAVIGRRLGVPVESRPREHFGGFANFAGADMCASSARTQALLGWKPTGPDLLADIDQPGYYGG